VESQARESGVPLAECPTCHSRPIEVDADNHGRSPGHYRFRGQSWECDCSHQITLRKHYLLAGIGDQYMRLDWKDYRGDPTVVEPVSTFLENWQAFKDNGMGLEFASRNLGVGKTFAATHVGKELVKRGEKVFFIPFLDSVRGFEDAGLRERLRSSTVLILDEVVPPTSERQKQFFAGEFEQVIRYRTNFNRVVLMTTNIEPDELHATFPRVYSLLEAKQLRILMRGEDARRGDVAIENLELALNNEVRPIT
jgi:DNA replication protein DnaC